MCLSGEIPAKVNSRVFCSNFLLLTTHFPPRRGGVETLNVQYLDFLDRQENVSVTVFTYDSPDSAEFKDYWNRVKVIRANVPYALLNYMTGLKSVSTLGFLGNFLYLYLHLQTLFLCSLINLRDVFRARVILANGAMVESFVAYLLSLVARKRYVISWNTDFSGSFANIITKFCLRNAGMVRVNGEDIKNKFLDLKAVKADNVFVAKHIANTKTFYPISRHKARSVLNLPQEQFVFLFAGALNKFKFADIICEALPIILGQDKSFFFIFIGQGPFEPRIRELQQKYGFNVLYVEDLVSPEILDLYINASDIVLGSADIFYPSKIVIETLACGVPVLLFNVPGPIEKRKFRLRFKIPLSQIFFVGPHPKDVSYFLLKNKVMLRNLRDDLSKVQSARDYIVRNNGEGLLFDEIGKLLELSSIPCSRN